MYSEVEKRKKKVDEVKKKYERKAKNNRALFQSKIFIISTAAIITPVILCTAISLNHISDNKSFAGTQRYSLHSAGIIINEYIQTNTDTELETIYCEERKGGKETPIQPFPEETEEILAEPLIVEESIIYEDTGDIDKSVIDYMYKAGEEHDIPGEILQAIAKVESNYNPNAISKTNDHGLMQINASNFKWLGKRGITDWYDPYQSIDAAIIIITETRKSANTDNWGKILMAYNSGIGNAKKKWKKGVYSSSYSREVLSMAEELGYNE